MVVFINLDYNYQQVRPDHYVSSMIGIIPLLYLYYK
jgi:hypothetical protein